MVAKIKKAVSRPSAVIFTAQDDGSKEALYMNGLRKISATPTKSPLQDVKVTITAEGSHISKIFSLLFFQEKAFCVHNVKVKMFFFPISRGFFYFVYGR